MRDEPKSVLENVARLERENADLAARIEKARAEQGLEATIQTRPRTPKPSTLRFAAAISFGLAFGLVMVAMTLMMSPPRGGAYDSHDTRGGSAGVCR